MDFLGVVQQNLHNLFIYTVPFLFVLTVIVFFHELGHFLVARWCGVKVDAFSIGFGREIVGFTDRKGTRWKLSWIPLGGYVKFVDDEEFTSSTPMSEEEDRRHGDREGDFHSKPLWQRAAVVAAGPIANFILAIVIFAGVFAFVGRPVMTAQVDAVQPGSAAEVAGFRVGDVVKTVDGAEIETFAELQRIVSTHPGEQLAMVVERDGAEISLSAVPTLRERTDSFGNTFRIGVLGISRSNSSANTKLERMAVPQALAAGAKETWFVIDRTFHYLAGLVSGREKADQLGGPLRIAQVSGQLASISFVALVNLAAVLSVSIGLLNLFPIPMLDGGHLAYYLIEAIRGRPLSEQAMQVGFKFGLAAVLMLMIFATWNDLIHLGGSIGAF